MSSFGLIVVTHGGLAEGFSSAVELIVGHQENMRTIGLKQGQGVEEINKAIDLKIKELNMFHSIYIMSDLYGGTPCNSSIIVSKTEDRIRLFAGVNLPMLLHFFTSSTKDPEQLANELVGIGKDSIQIVDIPNKKDSIQILE